jgi:hypothetical protein
MTAFVPEGDSRRDTAILLLGAALDAGLDDSASVASTQGGYWISDELAEALGEDQDTNTTEEPS